VLLVDWTHGHSTQCSTPTARQFDLYDLLPRREADPRRSVILVARLPNLDLCRRPRGGQARPGAGDMHRREDQTRIALERSPATTHAIILNLSPNLGQLVITEHDAAPWLIIPTDASKGGRTWV